MKIIFYIVKQPGTLGYSQLTDNYLRARVLVNRYPKKGLIIYRVEEEIDEKTVEIVV